MENTLCDTVIFKNYLILEVIGENRRRLMEIGILQGKYIKLVNCSLFKYPKIFKVNGYYVALDKECCLSVFIKFA